MATPKLKTAGAPAAPTRLLRPSGAAPAKQIKLKSATGKTIEPKKAPAPKPVASTPAPEEEVITPQPVAEVAPEPIEEPPVTPEPEITATEETPVEETPTETAAETAAADEEAMRLAQEEYERQMEEYNRQMEEYNRQMAALQAAEDTTTTADTSTPIEEGADEATSAEEQAEASPTPEPKKKKKKAASISNDEMAEIQAMLEEEQKQPIWKTVPFMVGCGLLAVTIGICTVLIVQKNAEDARIKAHIDYTNKLLRRAQEINMKGVENLKDAGIKKVDVTCTMADAKALMEVVVDPFVLGENGKPRYGARAEGVAQNACLLLGLAAEQDTAIRDMIFDTMGKHCTTIKPSLFNWLLQRVAISDAKGVNASLKKLSKTISEKKTAKPWAKKTQLLAYIWECIGLRVTEADVKEIIDLLKDDTTDTTLAKNLCICLDNILMMMDDEAAKAKVGDEIFNTMPEKLRSNNSIAATLGRACAPAALAYYKEEIASDKGWSGTAPILIGCWGSDDILEYVFEQKEANSDNARVVACINEVIGTILKQDRPRSQEMADKLLNICFENRHGDTSELQEIIYQTDPDSADYIGDNNPKLAELKEKQKELEALSKQKERVINVLGTLSDHDWVVNTLKQYTTDTDGDIKHAAERALEKTHANGIRAAQMRDDYKARSKD